MCVQDKDNWLCMFTQPQKKKQQRGIVMNIWIAHYKLLHSWLGLCACCDAAREYMYVPVHAEDCIPSSPFDYQLSPNTIVYISLHRSHALYQPQVDPAH